MRQIVADVVGDAVKCSPDGGVSAGAARRGREGIEVSVEDEGIGVPESERALIFSKFYRGGSDGRELASPGTGLGLFIAKELLEAMRGRLWVRPREERGPCFAVCLPAAGAAVVAAGLCVPLSSPTSTR